MDDNKDAVSKNGPKDDRIQEKELETSSKSDSSTSVNLVDDGSTVIEDFSKLECDSGDDFKLRRDENDGGCPKLEVKSKGTSNGKSKVSKPVTPQPAQPETTICLNLLIKEATEVQSTNATDFEIAVDNNIAIETFSLESNSNSESQVNLGNETQIDLEKRNNETTIGKKSIADTSLSTSLKESSYLEKHHSLMRPDQMIEIPTQGFINIADSVINEFSYDESMENTDEIYDKNIELTSFEAVKDLSEDLQADRTETSHMEKPVEDPLDSIEEIQNAVTYQNDVNNSDTIKKIKEVTGTQNIESVRIEDLETNVQEKDTIVYPSNIANEKNKELSTSEISKIDIDLNKEHDELIIDKCKVDQSATVIINQPGAGTAEQPKTHKSVTNQLTTTSTAVTDQSSTSAVVSDQQATIKAVTDQPVTIKVFTDLPSTYTAVTVQPSTATAATDQLSTSTAVSDQPSTSTAVSDQPVTIKVFTDQPSTSTAVTVQPSTATAATDQPSTSTAVFVQPSISTAVSDQPVTIKVFSDQTSTSTAVTVQPSTATAATDQPSSSTGVSVQPSTSTAVPDQPVTIKAVTDQPVIIKAITEKPSTPAVTDQPSTATAVSDQPVTIQAVTDQPVIIKAITDQPSTSTVTDQPSTATTVSDQPVNIKAVTDQPVIIKAITDQPSTSAVTDQPSTATTVSDQPVTIKAVTDQPVIIKAITDQPSTSAVTDQPSTATAVSDQPVTIKAVTDQPVIIKAITDHSSTSTVTDQPSTATAVPDQPVTIKAVTDQPVIIKAITEKPSTPAVTDQPSTATAVSDQPVTIKAVSDQPVTFKAITDQPNTSTTVTDQTSTSTTVTDQPSTSTAVPTQPVTNKTIIEQPIASMVEAEQLEHIKTVADQPIPTISSTVDPSAADKQSATTTFEIPDQDNDEVTEIDDSLGLLAESSRVMDDDDDEDDGDADDDEDYEPDDESSNQMTAEHSEDSNNQQSETDQPQIINQLDKDTPSPTLGKEFIFPVDDGTEMEKEDEGIDYIECEEMDIPSPTSDADKVEDMEVKLADITKSLERPDKADKQVKGREEKTADEATKTDSKQTSKVTSPTQGLIVQTSPSKTKVLNISKPSMVVNYVDLEESSSEDDIQLVKQKSDIDTSSEVTSINLPKDIDVMSASAGDISEIVTKDDELVINVPKTQAAKTLPKLNTSELTIKTTKEREPKLIIPEAKMSNVVEANQTVQKKKTNLSLEIFSVDSDEDECTEPVPSPAPTPHPPPMYKCGNPLCRARVTSSTLASAPVLLYFGLDGKKKPRVCDNCLMQVTERQYNMAEGVKSFMPLMELDLEIANQELVGISDSDSDDGGETQEEEKELIGEEAAEFLNENLANILNETWNRYELDTRLQDTQNEIMKELDRLQTEGVQINSMIDDCQTMTDKLRNELYATFEPNRKEIRPIIIVDNHVASTDKLSKKRRLSSSSESSNKRATVAQSHPDMNSHDDCRTDDDSVDEVSVVRLCAEAAPASLPGPGELLRPPLHAGVAVHAMRTAFGSWAPATVLDVLGKAAPPNQNFLLYKVKFDYKVKNPCRTLLGRCLAYTHSPTVRLTIGTRVVALFKDEENSNREAFYSGVVAEVPNPVNSYRYLVFFDDGYAQYVQHANTRLVAQCSASVWDEVHPMSREFVYHYLRQYPERPMVRLHAGQRLKVELNGKWYESPVIKVDASLVQVYFTEERRREWIYRGSTRLEPLFLELQAAERTRHRPLPRAKGQNLVNVPYVEYTREEQNKPSAAVQQQNEQEEIRRQRAVAKKSTTTQVPIAVHNASSNVNANTITSRVVYYTPKLAVKPLKMVPHNCGPRCKRSDVLSLKELRTYNPLAKPLLSGWERQIVRVRGLKEVMYRAPCGRRVRSVRELHRYLRLTRSDLPVDLFDFAPATHCLAEFVLNKCLVGKKDLSHGRENVPVPCVNYYDTSLPEFCSYSTERTPTDGVPLNLDPEFLCGCDCTDDCQDKTKCACWKLTLEGARTIGLGSDVGYVYRRLPEPLPSGIYECNSRCKCKNTCLNRVVQHPLQLKLQVFKTLNRGWGIRSLNDVPKGSFLCIYAGNLLTDATANLDGLNEGDEYLAELDYIEVVEQMKEGYEEDIPEADKRKDKKESGEAASESEGEMTTSEEEQPENDKDDDDDDFRPNVYETQMLGDSVRERSSRRRKQEKEAKQKEKEEKEEKEKESRKEKGEEDCITISDDEEVREPSRFTAQAGMDANGFKPKYKSVRSHFGKDEACYIMDAKVQGNIGRYLNHSCSPNVFVQNVFVDSHDPRFPWVAFFALCPVRAGSELTWNYNYDVGSVPGKMLYCFCGAPNCRGRLL